MKENDTAIPLHGSVTIDLDGREFAVVKTPGSDHWPVYSRGDARRLFERASAGLALYEREKGALFTVVVTAADVAAFEAYRASYDGEPAGVEAAKIDAEFEAARGRIATQIRQRLT